MKLTELFEPTVINESVTFGVTQLQGSRSFGKEEMVPCWACDETGQVSGEVCDMCDGKKQIEEWVYPYKELNVANSNALEILQMLGLPSDELYGTIEQEQLPLVRRRLIMLMNQDATAHTKDPSVEQRMRTVSQDNGITKISQGPRVYHGGRSLDQINHYIKTLLDLIDFAQKNDAVITYG